MCTLMSFAKTDSLPAMSSAIATTTPSHCLTHNHVRRRPTRRGGVNNAVLTLRVNSPTIPSSIASSGSSLFGNVLLFPLRRHRSAVDGCSAPGRPFCPVMEWQDCTVKMEVGTPASVAYIFYSNRELIPCWMPFITSVEVLKEKPDLSRWSLKHNAFGINIEYSWLAQNMQPIPDQKIHWRSLEGLPNRGVVRFYPKGASSCFVELTVSYEVPQLLVPVASALQPFMEGLLRRCLERFAALAESKSTS